MYRLTRLHGGRIVHRGISGIEATIVLIAIVLVTAGLAFVVVTSGFEATQQAKSTITTSLSSAGSSVMISGKVFASGHQSDNALNVTAIPIRIAAGGESVNLAETLVSVRYVSDNVSHDDIYRGTLTGTLLSLQSAVQAAGPLGTGYIDVDPYLQGGWPSQTGAFVYWTLNENDNDILDSGEQAILAIAFSQNDRPQTDNTVDMELILSDGSTLSVERKIPGIGSAVVDLG